MNRIVLAALFLSLLTACGKAKPVQQTAEASTPVDVAIAEGRYTTEDQTGDLTIEEASVTSFTFELVVTTANAACTGEMEGKALLNEETNKWMFTHPELSCTLAFTFENGMVTVAEDGECDHGANCSFSNVYGSTGSFSSAKEEQQVVLTNLIDYYLALPDEYFTCEISRSYTAAQREAAIQYKNIDNGYLTAGFDELDTVQFALFKNKESKESFVALVYECGGGCMCTKRHFLRHTGSGWEDVYGEVFPDLSVLEENDVVIAFRLPEKGTTIEVYNAETNRLLAHLLWKVGKFDLVRK